MIYCKNLKAFGHISVTETLGISSTTFTQCVPKATEFTEITQNNCHYTVQGHSRYKVPKAIEILPNFNCLSKVHERYRRQTTDGWVTAYSKCQHIANLNISSRSLKTVRPMLSDRRLSVCPVCNVAVLWRNAWMDQDETWHEGRPRALGPSHIVLDGDPASLPKRDTAPNFWPMSVVAKRLDGLRCHLVQRGRRRRRHC